MFNSDSKSSSKNHTCPSVELPDKDNMVPFVGSMSFHDVALILGGACMVVANLVSFFLIMKHATHYSLPKEQKQIMRIVFTVPCFVIISFLAICFQNAAIYIEPYRDMYEALALASFFLLMCAFVMEDDEERRAFFATSGLSSAYTKAATAAFQFPLVMTIVAIAIDITQAAGIYCENSNKLYFAHIWITIIKSLSTVFAVVGILKFYKPLKPQISHRSVMPKLFAFKGIVFLNFIQTTAFTFLTSGGHLKPSEKLTYKDLTVGIPALIICIEMVIFSFIFSYVYRTSEYRSKAGARAVALGHGGYKGGFLGLGAVAEAFNVVDLVMGMVNGRGQKYESLGMNRMDYH